VIRTPLLPVDTLTSWAAGVEAPTALGDGAALEGALARDRARLRSRLQALVDRPEVREALFLASPSLFDCLETWRSDPQSALAIEHVLVRYLSRMAGRPEPLGLMAGYSAGQVGSRTHLELGGLEVCRRRTRLAMDYLCALAQAIGREPAFQAALTYRPNSSLVRAANMAFFYQTRFGGDTGAHRPVSCEVDGHVAAALDKAAAGATVAALEACLTEACGATAEEAAELVQELISGQLLVPDLVPAVTGAEPIDGMIEQLGAHPTTAPLAQRLSAVRTHLAEMDAAGLGAEPARYLEALRMLDGLPVVPELSRLFRVDFARAAPAATLDGGVLAEIARGVELTRWLGTARGRGSTLSAFGEAFVARYGTRVVRLVEALNPELGIGYPARGEREVDARGGGEAASAPLGLLAEKVGEALRRGQRELVLDEASLRQAQTREPAPLPGALAVIATVLAGSDEALARGEFRVTLDGVHGPSGARLLSRFSLADPALHEALVQHLRAEEALEPDAVFAEVVHLPGGPLDSLMCRTVLRGYEIPYLSRSGAAAGAQLPVDDLWVSVDGERIRLWSARLGKQIIPRLTCPHLFWRSDSVGLYRFLAELQEQGTDGEFWWSWGALGSMPFLPRVTNGRTILAAARWRTPSAELIAMSELPDAVRFEAVQRWRAERGLPRFVRLKQLPFDLDNTLSVDSLLDLARDGRDVVLRECFNAPTDLCARSPEGPLVHELVVPLVRKRRPLAPPPEPAPPVTRERSFPPGSEWLYAKLYTGPTLAEPVLEALVERVISPALESMGVDRWFFVRFADPEWHLRVRFRGEASRLRGELLPALTAATQAWLGEGQLWRVQLDTYEPETRRYGGHEGMDLAEQLFHADSEAVVELLRTLQGSGADPERWRFAFRSVDRLLADLGMGLSERLEVVSGIAAPLEAGFRRDVEERRQAAERFRRERRVLEALTFTPEAAPGALDSLEPALLRRSQRLLALTPALRSLQAAGRLTVPLSTLAPSFVHMHLNRFLRTAHRSQERLLCHFLARLYVSRLARERGGTPSEAAD
jgi:thiopeptide-type bacteriocin biosynthesis protein